MNKGLKKGFKAIVAFVRHGWLAGVFSVIVYLLCQLIYSSKHLFYNSIVCFFLGMLVMNIMETKK
jgi:hypothetical protein